MARVQAKAKTAPWRDRVLRLERVRAGDLAANEMNWRRHPPAQVEALKGVLSEVGFAGALLAYQDGGRLTLIDGHLRAGLDPEAEVPVLVLDVDRDEARALLATCDPLGAMAAPDQDALLALLETVSSQSQAVKDMLEALANGSYAPLMPMPNMEPEGLTDPDDVPEMPAESWVKRGDIFQLGQHRMMCGDSINLQDNRTLLNGTQVNLGLTSPPYAVGKEYETNVSFEEHLELLKAIAQWGLKNIKAGGFFFVNFGEIAPQSHASPLTGTKRACIYPISQDYWRIFRAAGYELYAQRIWYKPFNRLQQPFWTYHTSIPHYQEWEHIWTWRLPGGDGDEVYDWDISVHAIWDTRQESIDDKPLSRHVAAFPVCLPERALKAHTKVGYIVWDPFLGSGTTLIACEKLGRICYGCEIEPSYVQVALERWQNYTGQKAVKISDGNSHQD